MKIHNFILLIIPCCQTIVIPDDEDLMDSIAGTWDNTAIVSNEEADSKEVREHEQEAEQYEKQEMQMDDQSTQMTYDAEALKRAEDARK